MCKRDTQRIKDANASYLKSVDLYGDPADGRLPSPNLPNPSTKGNSFCGDWRSSWRSSLEQVIGLAGAQSARAAGAEVPGTAPAGFSRHPVGLLAAPETWLRDPPRKRPRNPISPRPSTLSTRGPAAGQQRPLPRNPTQPLQTPGTTPVVLSTASPPRNIPRTVLRSRSNGFTPSMWVLHHSRKACVDSVTRSPSESPSTSRTRRMTTRKLPQSPRNL